MNFSKNAYFWGINLFQELGIKSNLLKMNTLELKGSLLDLISKVNDNTRLARLFEAYYEIFATDDDSDWWDELPVEQQTRLTKSIEESYDPKNLIDHEEMKKKHAKWLRK